MCIDLTYVFQISRLLNPSLIIFDVFLLTMPLLLLQACCRRHCHFTRRDDEPCSCCCSGLGQAVRVWM